MTERSATLSLPSVLGTKRLILRPYAFEDVAEVLAYSQDPEWARYLPVPRPYLLSNAVEFIARQVLLDRAAQPS